MLKRIVKVAVAIPMVMSGGFFALGMTAIPLGKKVVNVIQEVGRTIKVKMMSKEEEYAEDIC